MTGWVSSGPSGSVCAEESGLHSIGIGGRFHRNTHSASSCGETLVMQVNAWSLVNIANSRDNRTSTSTVSQWLYSA